MITWYFIIGLLWLIYTEWLYKKMELELTNAARLRYFLLWPITVGVFIWGLIEYIIDIIRGKDNQ